MRSTRVYSILCLLCLLSMSALWMSSRDKVKHSGKRSTMLDQSSRLQSSWPSTEEKVLHHAKRMIRSAAEDLMYSLATNADMLPNGTKAFSAIVSTVLSKKWRRNVKNVDLFRFYLTNETKKLVYDEMMLTLKHRTKKDKTGGLAFHTQNLLPKPPYKSCSVVGSSGILLGSKCGRDIDAKDFVIRFNLAPMAGFEEDVGSKSNITTMNPSILKSYDKLGSVSACKNFSKSRLADQEGLIWTSAMKIKELNGAMYAIKSLNKSNLSLVRGNLDHFKLIGRFWKKYGLRHYPTSGFYFVNCALDLCSDVHLYGFWPFNHSLDGQTIKTHYYDTVNISTRHDASSELKLLVTMHRLGMLNFHIDDCSSELSTTAKPKQKNKRKTKHKTTTSQNIPQMSRG